MINNKTKKQKGFIPHLSKNNFVNFSANGAGSSIGAGFTLIELIVVMTIFLFIIGAALTIFISIFQNQKRILSEQQTLNQISYTEEYMSKALRMAKKETDENCLFDSQGDNHPGYIYLLTRYDYELGMYRGIKFLNQSGDTGVAVCQEFFLDNITPNGSSPLIFDEPSNPLVLKELKNSINDSDAVNLTSTNLKFSLVNPVRFVINGLTDSCGVPCGASDADSVQPKVTILFNIIIPVDTPDGVLRTIQTTVSQRNLNVQ